MATALMIRVAEIQRALDQHTRSFHLAINGTEGDVIEPYKRKRDAD
jgi:hypothetical protein